MSINTYITEKTHSNIDLKSVFINFFFTSFYLRDMHYWTVLFEKTSRNTSTKSPQQSGGSTLSPTMGTGVRPSSTSLNIS